MLCAGALRECMKKLGIMGGMGPAATARLFSRIIELTDVVTDQEHIKITILNNPQVPDRTAYILDETKESFVPVLQEMARALEQDGCEVLAMPCNAAHSHWRDLNDAVERATFINMLAETASLLRTLGCARPGLLATDGIIRSGVFHDELAAAGLEAIVPDEPFQRQVMSAIYDYVKAGRAIPEGLLDEVCDHVLERGADSLILGCTELAFLGIPTRYKGAPVADTIDVLAWRSVIECGAPAKDLTAIYA